MDRDWLSDTRTSYDTVAAAYAELFHDGLARYPSIRSVLSFFAELLRDVGGTGLLAGHLHGLGLDVVGNVPDEEVAHALAEFHRVLRPGGVAMVGFHVGDEHRIKTQGYGGLPMRVPLYLRPVARVAGWMREAGFAVEAMIVDPDDEPMTSSGRHHSFIVRVNDHSLGAGGR